MTAVARAPARASTMVIPSNVLSTRTKARRHFVSRSRLSRVPVNLYVHGGAFARWRESPRVRSRPSLALIVVVLGDERVPEVAQRETGRESGLLWLFFLRALFFFAACFCFFSLAGADALAAFLPAYLVAASSGAAGWPSSSRRTCCPGLTPATLASCAWTTADSISGRVVGGGRRSIGALGWGRSPPPACCA